MCSTLTQVPPTLTTILENAGSRSRPIRALLPAQLSTFLCLLCAVQLAQHHLLVEVELRLHCGAGAPKVNAGPSTCHARAGDLGEYLIFMEMLLDSILRQVLIYGTGLHCDRYINVVSELKGIMKMLIMSQAPDTGNNLKWSWNSS